MDVLAAEGAASEVPHSPQKSSSGSFAAPHFGHEEARGAPHFEQNLRPSRLSIPHLTQRILGCAPILTLDASEITEDQARRVRVSGRINRRIAIAITHAARPLISGCEP